MPQAMASFLATQVAGKPVCCARRSAFAYHRFWGTVGEILEAVHKLRLEGLIGERIDSTYEPGERSDAWIKLRTNIKQEFVIGGDIANRRENAAGLFRSWSARPLSSNGRTPGNFVAVIKSLRRSFENSVNSAFL